jgi:hypothetical protein
MSDSSGASSSRADERQAEQAKLVEMARTMPGVADVVDVYGRLSPYVGIAAYVQPAQVRNATGGNT